MLITILAGAGGLVAGYYVGTKYSTSTLSAQITTLLADAKTEEAALVAKIKAFLSAL